jgi:shikimate kinase
MELPKNLKVFLIGLPGSGKTTLAKQVAEQASLPFIDLDKEIETEEGRKIEQLFSEEGEPYFRQVEQQVLNAFCGSMTGFVMATGGGAPCFGNNLEEMKKAGVVIFLDVPAKEISDRIQKQSINRPLLKNQTSESLKDKIEFLRSQRISFYRQAQHTVEGKSIEAGEIMGVLRSYSAK